MSVPRRTETDEAPARQGATTDNIGNIRGRSNAAGRDASSVECRGTLTAGSWWRATRGPAVVAVVAGIFVWNLVFDLWMGQAERQYLWNKAAHALGEARDVTLEGSMAVAICEGAWVATAWTVAVVAEIALAAWLGYRAGRRGAAGSAAR